MDIEAIFTKAIQPYEARMQELQEADKRKELEIKELKAAINAMHKIVQEYNTHNAVPVPAKGGKLDPKIPRPNTAVLPSRQIKPAELKGEKVEKKPTPPVGNNTKVNTEKDGKTTPKNDNTKKHTPPVKKDEKKIEKKPLTKGVKKEEPVVAAEKVEEKKEENLEKEREKPAVVEEKKDESKEVVQAQNGEKGETKEETL